MLNPTFASFKSVKPGQSQTLYSVSQAPLSQISLNVQPKTFHELKFSTNLRNHNQNQAQQNKFINFVNQSQTKLSFCNNHTRKTPMNNLLKKNHGQTHILQAQNRQCADGIKSKPKLATKNYVTAKKVQVDRQSKQKSITRPCITGPSLLKNKSFIYTTVTPQGKQNYTSRPSHDHLRGPFLFAQDMSIDSIQRKSDQASISVSIGSSNGDKQGQSFLGLSKFQDSINSINSVNLKDSCSSSKLEDKTLNFSRKTNKTIYKGDIGKLKMQHDSTYFGDVSSLYLMARQMKSSFESSESAQQQVNKKSFQNNSINFSKKFQQYRKPKQNIQATKSFSIEQFELMQQMGQGKYGKVYMARHKPTNFICALKAFSKSKIKQQNIQQPLIRQIKIQMYLNHPNIVKLYGFFHDKENLYLIMECCLSGHLLKLIKQRKIFEQNQILQIISNVFQAVSFLHCHGIIHRDLKPENIVIQNGIYKICDFGWAAYAKGDTRTTFCGTPLYVCPEVLKGNQYDSKADVWGLGVLTYQLAYGRVPFPIWSQADMIKIVKDPVYFPTWTSISQRMQNLIKSMLNKDPSKRLSLNQILSSPIISQYVGTRFGLKSEIESLF